LLPSECGGARLIDGAIEYDAYASPREQRAQVARCVAEYALATRGIAATDEDVTRIARALTGA
jgi:hypothetical protein